LAVGQKINIDFVMGGKQHDLILFRECCIRKKLDPPRQLFGYDAAEGPTAELEAFRSVLEWESQPAFEKLGIVIKSTYTTFPWIVDYFVISMFPAMFGQFASEEYMTAAAKLLASYMWDDLIDQLVGSYLLHCFLFRDRLAASFFQRVAASGNVTRDGLLDSLLASVEHCIPYFCHQHMQIVNLL
jgi:hypothetical protein